jgi:hypothetical protein
MMAAIDEKLPLGQWGMVKPDHEAEITFCGLQISYKGKQLHTSQRKYIAECLKQRGGDRGSKVPGQESVGEDQELYDTVPPKELVTEAQAQVGELIWIASKSRPDIARATSEAAALVGKKPVCAIERCSHIRRYLTDTQHYALVATPFASEDFQRYENQQSIRGALEEYECCEVDPSALNVWSWSDASHAPKGQKSVGGSVILIGSMPVSWRSHKQSFITTSTCESELLQQSEGSHLAAGISACLEEWLIRSHVTQMCDNQATLQKVGGAASWRTRHLNLRSGALREKVILGGLTLMHCSGLQFTADGLTKFLPASKQQQFAEMLNMNPMQKRFKHTLQTLAEVMSADIEEDFEDRSGEGEVKLNSFQIDENILKFASNVVAGVIRQGMDQHCAPCPPCESTVVQTEYTGGLLSHSLIGLLTGCTGVFLGNKFHTAKTSVKDVGHQSQCSYTLSGDRFSYLGQSRADRNTEVGQQYWLERNAVCCRRRKSKS